MTNSFRNGIRLLAVLSIFVTSIQVAPTASAVSMGPLYDGTSGDVACTTDGEPTGFFTIVNNIVTTSSNCLGSVTIPEGVTSVGRFAFRRGMTQSEVSSLAFPDSVISIGIGAFDGALRLLQTLILPSNLQTIEAGAFVDAASITTLVIPSGVTNIGPFAFAGLASITSLTLPTNLRQIGGNTFAETFALRSYQYCGTLVSDASLSSAGLSNKTKTCVGNGGGSIPEGASDAARAAAIAQREAEQLATRTEIVNIFQNAQTVDAQTFAKANISGITESNISEVNAEILALPKEAQVDISHILKIARKYEVVGKISSETVNTILPKTFIEVGLIPADSLHKAALANAVRNLFPGERDSYAEIKAAIEAETARIMDRAERLSDVKARRSTRK
jgi:hypothetical protein